MNDSEDNPSLSYRHSPGFTPVRRPVRPVIDDSPANSAHAAWTAARCNRLLRPLSSRIASLRRAQPNPLQGSSTLDSAFSTVPLACECSQNNPVGSKKPKVDGDDQDWEPDHWRRKRVRRTYSSKGQSSTDSRPRRQYRGLEPCEESKSEFAFAAVHSLAQGTSDNSGLTDIRGPSITQIANDTAKPAGCFDKMNGVHPRKTFRQIAKSTDPANWLIYDGLWGGLEHLLKTTGRSKPQSRTGARSLFRSCLRAIPTYIATENASLQDECPDSSEDLALNTLEDLEAFGLSDGTGWKPLKEVVRAQGMWILQDAIRERVLPTVIVQRLALLCSELGAYEEAESLSSALLSHPSTLNFDKAVPPKLLSHSFPVALQILKEVAIRSGRWGSFFGSVSYHLENMKFPVRWIAIPHMTECWTHLIASIGRSDAITYQSMRLLHNISLLSYRIDDDNHGLLEKDDMMEDGLTATIASIITSFLSINSCTLNRQELSLDTPGLAKQAITILSEVSLHQFRVADNSLEHYTALVHSRLYLTALAMELLPAIGGHDTTQSTHSHRAVFSAWSVRALDESTLGLFSNFLLSTAACCKRVTDLPEFPFLQKMSWHLLKVAEAPGMSEGSATLCEIVVKAAFLYAETSTLTQHLDWAIEIEERARRIRPICSVVQSSKQVASMTSLKPSAAPGFRWEEGLCEWVAKTPGAKKSVALHKAPQSAVVASPSTDTGSSARTSVSSSASDGNYSDTDESDSGVQGLFERSFPKLSSVSALQRCMDVPSTRRIRQQLEPKQSRKPTSFSHSSDDEQWSEEVVRPSELRRVSTAELLATMSDIHGELSEELDELAGRLDVRSQVAKSKESGKLKVGVTRERILVPYSTGPGSRISRPKSENHQRRCRNDEVDREIVGLAEAQSSEDELGNG